MTTFVPHPRAELARQQGQDIAMYTASAAAKFIEVISADGAVKRYDVAGKLQARHKAKEVNALAWNF